MALGWKSLIHEAPADLNCLFFSHRTHSGPAVPASSHHVTGLTPTTTSSGRQGAVLRVHGRLREGQRAEPIHVPRSHVGTRVDELRGRVQRLLARSKVNRQLFSSTSQVSRTQSTGAFAVAFTRVEDILEHFWTFISSRISWAKQLQIHPTEQDVAQGCDLDGKSFCSPEGAL